MTALSAFQYLVGHWGKETFGENPSIEGLINHLEEEVAELNAAADAEQNEEAADCLILLLRIAHEQGFDLLEAAREKLTELRKRRWHPPDERGVCRHVKSGEEAGFTVRDMLHEAIDAHAQSGEALFEHEPVGGLVYQWFEGHPQYDGLYNDVGPDGCGCSAEDGCPCGEYNLDDCVAAHERATVDGNVVFFPGPMRDNKPRERRA